MDREYRALPRRTLHLHIATHDFAQALRYRQPQTRAAMFPRERTVHLIEGPEQLSDTLGRYARSRVSDVHANPVLVAPQLSRNRERHFAVVRELAGVAQQVQE